MTVKNPKTKAKQVEQKTQTKAAAPTKAPASAGDGKPEAKAAASTPPARPRKIKILKPDTPYRGARAAWFGRLKEFDGKTEEEFIESAKANPPALTRAGTPENPTGWLRFFDRTHVASFQTPA